MTAQPSTSLRQRIWVAKGCTHKGFVQEGVSPVVKPVAFGGASTALGVVLATEGLSRPFAPARGLLRHV